MVAYSFSFEDRVAQTGEYPTERANGELTADTTLQRELLVQNRCSAGIPCACCNVLYLA